MTKEQEIRKEIKQIVDEMPTSEIRERIEQDEQEEVIEYFKKQIEICTENADICDDNNFDEEATCLRKQRYMFETVLSMLKQNSAEIEKKNTELAEKSAEIEKDKIIDLMAEHINYLSDELVQATGRNELEFCNGNKCCIDSDYSCEQCIKQYFERKATNNG